MNSKVKTVLQKELFVAQKLLAKKEKEFFEAKNNVSSLKRAIIALGGNDTSEVQHRSKPNFGASTHFVAKILRKHNRPMHVKELAKNIFDEYEKSFDAKIIHNSLDSSIKSGRNVFVKVGPALFDLAKKGSANGVSRVTLRRNKIPFMCAEILKKEGKPMHVTDLQAKMKAIYNRDVDAQLISQTILRSAKEKRGFEKVAPATFQIAI